MVAASSCFVFPQTQDIISNLFSFFVELSGDGRVGRDNCIRGGVCSFPLAGGAAPQTCVVIGTFKGHTPTAMQAANYGMASPHGYRSALRLMRLAERFGVPVVTLVDTVGAWPTFGCEGDGQSEAIASNLTVSSCPPAMPRTGMSVYVYDGICVL